MDTKLVFYTHMIVLSCIFSAIMFVWFTPPTTNDKKLATVSYLNDFGENSTSDQSKVTLLRKGHDMVDVSYQSRPFYNLKGLRFGGTGITNSHGTYLFGAMLGKTMEFNKIGLTVASSINYSNISSYDASRLSFFINYKSTFDITYAIKNNIHAGIGLMHISNASVKKPNSGINAVRGTIYFFM